jgi:hypothetical protein
VRRIDEAILTEEKGSSVLAENPNKTNPNPTYTDTGLNPSVCVESPTTYHLNRGTAGKYVKARNWLYFQGSRFSEGHCLT